MPAADSEYLSPRISDSHRLFGPNLFSALPGAVIEVQCTDANAVAAIDLWLRAAQHLVTMLEWPAVEYAERRSSTTVSLFLTAPIDGLMTATDVAERAWVIAENQAAGVAPPDDLSAARQIAALRAAYAQERTTMPGFAQIEITARRVGRNVTFNDRGIFVGSGAGHQFALRESAESVVPISGVPLSAKEVADPALAERDCPVMLVTGSNGKTTTARMLAAMWRASGRTPGWSCSDGVWIGDEQVERGDFSGPGGAHRVLTDARVEAAILESARGGMLRRGLAATAVHGAVITNIAADHFGEYGVESLDDLADVKAIVTRALRDGAPVVLNADDESLVALSQRVACPVAWFSRRDSLLVHRAAAHGVYAATVRDGVMLLCTGHEWVPVGTVTEMPITYGGNAVHNIENALAATLLAAVVGVPVDAIQQALAAFGATPHDNPGRLLLRTVGHVTVIMDYAHNPDGLASLCRTASTMLANRRLLLLGQAGDRDDAQLQALARTAWQALSFDRIIVKEMERMRRGREIGATTAVLHQALRDAGAPAEMIDCAPSELDGVRRALAWAEAGDLLVLGVHAERDAVYALIDGLESGGWQAGDPLPAASQIIPISAN